jgi:hypothetical protein
MICLCIDLRTDGGQDVQGWTECSELVVEARSGVGLGEGGRKEVLEQQDEAERKKRPTWVGRSATTTTTDEC